jgi:hypothetical protein
MSIAIIIPCHSNDYIFLNSLIPYINNFFIEKPQLISIAISGINKEQLNLIHKIPSLIPIIITYTGETVPPGINRNIAINKSNTDYVLAIDSDDIPNPNILSVYKKIINKYPTNLILSSFDYNPEKLSFKTDFTKINDTNYIKSKTISKKSIICDFPIAHGSGLLIKKSIFKNIRYSKKNYGEDTEFCVKLLFFFGNVYALDFNAIAYLKDDNLLRKHYSEIFN